MKSGLHDIKSTLYANASPFNAVYGSVLIGEMGGGGVDGRPTRWGNSGGC